MTDTFTCYLCGGTFDKAWSDEEAEAQLAAMAPTMSKEQCGVVCEDCYQTLPAWAKSIAG